MLHIALLALASLALAGDYSDVTQVGFTVGVLTKGTGWSNRLFTVHNKCSQSVSYILTPGAYPQALSCDNWDGDCPAGFHCGLHKGDCPGAACSHICYWAVPVPASGSYTLGAGASDTLTFPIYSNGLSSTWSGNIGACEGSQCPNDPTRCKTSGCSSGEMGSPVTMAEFTLQKNNLDYYDISIINGVSVGFEMTPEFDKAVPSYWNPWFCGGAGAANPITPHLGKCSWSFTPPAGYYRWVTSGGAACSSNANCGSGQVCGVSNVPGTTQRLYMTCGTQLGMWTADQMCGLICDDGIACTRLRTGVTDYVGCMKGMPNGNLYGLLACANSPQYSQSCYQPGAASTCCGCANWDQDGVAIPPTGTNYTAKCVNINPSWTEYVKPQLKWLKAGCPAAYTFPYDDITSTFTCYAGVASGSASQNGVVYHLTFCPS